MRRTLLILAAASAATVVCASAALAAGGLKLTEAGGVVFPERAFVISLPSTRSLTPADVVVREDGGAVADVSLVPASVAGRNAFGVVLVVDASQSMVGEPFTAALAAARAFAARRPPNQQLAIVTFNDSAVVTLPFTTSSQEIEAALAVAPPLAYGTHIFDAEMKALGLLRGAAVQSGSIVLLSDGEDTGSAARAKDVLGRASAEHVRLFTVGLRSSHFSPGTLRKLASGGRGDYVEAKSVSQLEPLYDQLGAQFAREYLLRYKSFVGPHTRVHVRVTVAGVGTARSGYLTPSLPVDTTAPYHESIVTRVWTSWYAMLLIVLICTLGVGAAVTMLLRQRGSDFRRRMSNFVSLPATERSGAPRRTVLTGMLGDAEGSLGRKQFWTRFEEELEIAQIKTPAIRVVAWAVVATIVAALLIILVTGSVLLALLALVIPFIVRGWAKRKLLARRRAFSDQLPDSLDILASALRAGHSLVGALSVVVESSSDPIRSELARVVADEQLGVPLEDALEVVVKRMDSADLEQVALVAQLQREMGGNAAEVIDRVTETVRERSELRRLVKTLTAQGRMSGWVVSLLPVGLFVVITIINPGYFHPLWSHTVGRGMAVLAVLLGVGGSYVIRRIVEIKV